MVMACSGMQEGNYDNVGIPGTLTDVRRCPRTPGRWLVSETLGRGIKV